MEPDVWAEDEAPHGNVMSNLLDLQARLRGDPASLSRGAARRRVPADESVTVFTEDVQVVEEQPRRNEPDPLVASVDEAEDRILALQRRLQFLELEIDAYHTVIAGEVLDDPLSVGDADVIDLQHEVKGRFTRG